MAKKKRTPGEDRCFKEYKTLGRYAKNKKAKIEKHLRAHPEDEQAQAALKNIKQYSRKKPHSRQWSPDRVRLAQAEKKLRAFWNEMKYVNYQTWSERMFGVQPRGYQT